VTESGVDLVSPIVPGDTGNCQRDRSWLSVLIAQHAKIIVTKPIITSANRSVLLTVLASDSDKTAAVLEESRIGFGAIEMTFDQALEVLKGAWIKRSLTGGSARLNARLFAARRLTDSHPEIDRRRYDAALDDANQLVASHRRTLQAWPSRFRTI